MIAGAAVALAVAVGVLTALRGGDAGLVSEAAKSFGYRWEYWRSTMAMIARHPWLGVGPGNFQDYYTQFKLPEASEEIRDPHNFLLEVWATAGTLALVALVEVLAMFGWRAWRGPAVSQTPDAEIAGPRPSDDPNRHAKFMLGGGGLGVGMAFLIGPSVGLEFSEYMALAVLAVGAAVVTALWPWITGGTLPPRLPAVALAVLAIDLLATGGIAIPGVAGTFWILLALGLNALDAEPSTAAGPPPTRRQRLAPAIALAVSLMVAAMCFQEAYGPITASRAAMWRGDRAKENPDARRRAYLDAAAADPLSADPWVALAELELDELRNEKRPGPARRQRFATAAEHVTQLQPHSAAAWQQVGRWYMELSERNHNAEAAASAVECYKNAVELYPNSGTLHGEYAVALAAAGDAATARRQAKRALELDALTPHIDKKLTAKTRAAVEALVADRS